METVAVLTMKVIGASVMSLLAIWLLWQVMIHVGNMFDLWVRLLVWTRFRRKCKCEASRPETYGLTDFKFNWKSRLTSRGRGVF